MRFNKPNNVPFRQIAIKSGVDQRTVARYFKGESIRYSKEMDISKVIKTILIENEHLKKSVKI